MIHARTNHALPITRPTRPPSSTYSHAAHAALNRSLLLHGHDDHVPLAEVHTGQRRRVVHNLAAVVEPQPRDWEVGIEGLLDPLAQVAECRVDCDSRHLEHTAVELPLGFVRHRGQLHADDHGVRVQAHPVDF